MVLIPRVDWLYEYNNIDVYQEVQHTKNVRWERVVKSGAYGRNETFLVVDDAVSRCIDLFFENKKKYADLTLCEFLDRTCVTQKDSPYSI